MILLAEVGESAINGGQIAVNALVVSGLGVLVKWWMSATEHSIRSVAEAVGKIAEQVGIHSKEIAVLQAHHEAIRDEIKTLKDRQHELDTEVQKLASGRN